MRTNMATITGLILMTNKIKIIIKYNIKIYIDMI